MGKPHVMMVPFPAHGHVIPLLELAQLLAKQGIKVTFVNTEIIHETISVEATLDDRVRLVSVPDGLESRDRFIPGKLTETVYKLMPLKIKDLIKEIDESEDERDKISCVVYDQSIGTICEVAKEMGLKCVAFSPAAAALLILGFNIPKMIEDGIIDTQGVPLANEMVQFAPTMPIMSPSDFVWHRIKIPTLQKIIFEIMTKNNQATKLADWLICNSAHDLELGAFALAPNRILPIGPLSAANRLDSSTNHFFKQDSNCLDWLDQQPLGSVIYVAFGSSTMMSSAQFQELGRGLEQVNRPFLWVVRSDIKNGPENRNFLERFLGRVSNMGKIIEWAPQKRVLNHSSIACFITHCGWNSTVESVSSGVPMLCWPYFADQFINQSYVCDIWKVGLKFEYEASGIIVCEEIRTKIDQLLGDEVFRERALCLKEMMWSSGREGGSSYKNLGDLINWIQEQNC